MWAKAEIEEDGKVIACQEITVQINDSKIHLADEL